MTPADVRDIRLDAILAVRCQTTGDTAGLIAIVNANEDRVADFLAALLGLAEAAFRTAAEAVELDPVGVLDELAERTRSGAA